MMKIHDLNYLFRLNSIFIIYYFIIEFILVFIIDFKLNLIEIPGAVYLENKSLFPAQTFNSISITIILGIILFLLNVFPYARVVKKFTKNTNIIFFNDLDSNKYKILYWFGYKNLNLYKMLEHIKKLTTTLKIITVPFFLYMIFLWLYWLLGWDFINFPIPYLLLMMISKVKFFLFLFNILMFHLISVFLLGCLANIFLIIYSFFIKI